MSVILYTNTLDFGGVATFFVRMKQAFEENGIKSYILSFKNERENQVEDNLSIWKKMTIIRKTIKRNSCKTVITNYGIETLLIKLATIGLNVKIISVVHVRSKIFISKHIIGIKKLILEQMIKISFVVCDKCVAVSDSLREELILEGWVDKNKIVTIYNPVINNSYAYYEKNINTNYDVNIGIIGWIYDIKNQKDAIRAIKIINDERFKLHIIGGIGNLEYYNEVNDMITDLKLENQVFIEGIKEDIFNEIKKLDILVLTSKTEALPTVIIEALSCGVPVISSDCKVGPREILGGGHYGYLYEENNIKMLSEYIEYLAKNPKEYNEMSKRGIERARDFTFSKAALNYKYIIENL